MNISHDQGHGRFHTHGRRWDVVVAGQRVLNRTLEAEDTEMSPTGGKVGFGYFGYTCERHVSIIRFSTHKR